MTLEMAYWIGAGAVAVVGLVTLAYVALTDIEELDDGGDVALFLVLAGAFLWPVVVACGLVAGFVFGVAWVPAKMTKARRSRREAKFPAPGDHLVVIHDDGTVSSGVLSAGGKDLITPDGMAPFDQDGDVWRIVERAEAIR